MTSVERKHSLSMIIEENIHESRQSLIKGRHGKPNKKPCRLDTLSSKNRTSSSINAIKKRLRDVTRRLERSETASAEMRVQDERARSIYLQELAVAQAERTKQRMIKKYHMVRFFERQKASRLLKKVQKTISAIGSTETVESLKKQMHEVEVDLNYTLYHPLSEVYISLYPKTSFMETTTITKDVENSNDDIIKQKPPIWYEIEDAMINGTLEKIRNRVSVKPVSPLQTFNQRQEKNKSKKVTVIDGSRINRRQRRSQLKEIRQTESKVTTQKKESHEAKDIKYEENEDSDGGFFE